MNLCPTNKMKPRNELVRWVGLGALFTATLFSFVLAGCNRSGSKNEGGSAAKTEIVWLTNFDAALAQARSEGKLVVIDFFATWCGPCKMMDRNTFTDANVQKRVADFVPLKIDVDRQPEIAQRYGIEGLPTTMVVDAEGKPVTSAVGYLDPERFLKVLGGAGEQKGRPERGVLGEPAPGLGVKTWFNLPDGQTTVDVTDYKGKVVYLYGFQSWCPGCHSQGFPTLANLIKHYEGNPDVAFIAVQTVFEGFGTNTPDAARDTAQRYGLTIPVGHSGTRDEPSTVMQRYRTGGTPWTVIIGRDGVVRYNDFHIQPEAAVKLIGNLLAATSG